MTTTEEPRSHEEHEGARRTSCTKLLHAPSCPSCLRGFLVALILTAGMAVVDAQSPGCAPAGGLNFICGIQNPEDLVPVPNSRWLFASGMADGSGLHLIDTRAKRASTVYGGGKGTARADRVRFSNCPAPLDSKLAHLHGLSIRPASPGHFT